jgi:hypothetical protein
VSRKKCTLKWSTTRVILLQRISQYIQKYIDEPNVTDFRSKMQRSCTGYIRIVDWTRLCLEEATNNLWVLPWKVARTRKFNKRKLLFSIHSNAYIASVWSPNRGFLIAALEFINRCFRN